MRATRAMPRSTRGGAHVATDGARCVAPVAHAALDSDHARRIEAIDARVARIDTSSNKRNRDQPAMSK
ncbi:hypothetical protein [Burkholderia oklahomensis]|uniref:hypothetical protein n=2 Tax=Burkholderia oklahomensis TaxID=342113 RepID=UPI00076C72BF|nr:hypothetical protein [Burkholderia oklahomensis]AOI49986.1 hypothetical protein WI23_30300 [Burkholderia oklahomensis C6786]KUY53096.1 hypothetical protein WI23_23150 [Burkholderia oklahomensis C6786]MBI0364137.1 hypothetical protein [Burkholderia oklahomensis]